MGYSWEVLEGGSILWGAWDADFDLARDVPLSMRDEIKLLNGSRGPVVVVYDTRSANTNWDDMMRLSSSGSHEITTHPNLVSRILLTDKEVERAIAQNLNTDAFGNLQIHVTTSEDEALSLARQLLR